MALLGGGSAGTQSNGLLGGLIGGGANASAGGSVFGMGMGMGDAGSQGMSGGG